MANSHYDLVPDNLHLRIMLLFIKAQGQKSTHTYLMDGIFYCLISFKVENECQ